jgi:hypothetical protein
MRNIHIIRSKLCQWLGLWWQITIKDTRAPLIDTSARLQFFALVALLIFVLPHEGYTSWKEELTNTWRSLQALIYAFPLFLLLNAIVSAFKASEEQQKLGLWAGNKFVFHKPCHLKTVVVTDADNNKLTPFKVKGLPKGSSVDLIVEVEKGFDDRNVKVQFIARKDNPIMWDQYKRQNMLAFVPDDQTFYVTTLKQTPSNASTIKVYLMAWYAKGA